MTTQQNTPVEWLPKPQVGDKRHLWKVVTYTKAGYQQLVAHDLSATNAKLFAAAPDLLEACVAMIDEYESGREYQRFELRELCRAAIAKATKGGVQSA